MIRRSIRLVWTGAVLAFLAYVLFFVKLGERSAFEHMMRVIDTDEARELGHEVSVATKRLTKEIGEQVHDATKPPEADAGASQVPATVTDRLQDVIGPTFEREERIDSARKRESQ